MIQQQIGGRIRKKRIETGLSQEQVALLSGVTPTYLGQVERGERNPTVGFLEKVAESLGVGIIYFFDDASASDCDYHTKQISRSMQGLSDEQKNSVLDILSAIIKTIKD